MPGTKSKSTSKVIKVAVVGATGKMGLETCRAISSASDMKLVAAIDRREGGRRLVDLAGKEAANLKIEEKLGEALDRSKPHVLIDFTNATAAPANALSAINRGVSPVIGASGLSREDISAIREACIYQKVPALLVPNFAIGAVLMMRFAEMAAKWMPMSEIIEMHHDEKLDAPSGTAIRTAEMISDARVTEAYVPGGHHSKYAGARGAEVKHVPVHSVRLRGLVAHQEVLFGNTGELLTIRHDSMDRRSFMEGVKLAVRQVRGLEGIVIGLDKVMFR